MLVAQFESAIADARVEPKGVKVSAQLWKDLKEAGLIEMRDVAAWGLFDLGFKMPFYKNTCLIFDPELEFIDKNFQLPPNAV